VRGRHQQIQPIDLAVDLGHALLEALPGRSAAAAPAQLAARGLHFPAQLPVKLDPGRRQAGSLEKMEGRPHLRINGGLTQQCQRLPGAGQPIELPGPQRRLDPGLGQPLPQHLSRLGW